MLTVKDIIDYVDEMIDEQAEVPKGANELQRAIATGVILCLEDLKQWLQEKFGSLD